MNLKEIGLIAGGGAFALVLGLGAGGVARAPIIRALAPHPMAAASGTQELAANVPSEETPPAPPAPLPAKWETRDETPSAYVTPAPEDAAADAKNTAGDESAAEDASDVQVREPGQDYSRRDLAGAEEVTPDYAPPPAYDWPRPPPPAIRPPPPPPPYAYDSPDEDPRT